MIPSRSPTAGSDGSQRSITAKTAAFITYFTKRVRRPRAQMEDSTSGSPHPELVEQRLTPVIVELTMSNYRSVIADTTRDVVVEFYNPEVYPKRSFI